MGEDSWNIADQIHCSHIRRKFLVVYVLPPLPFPQYAAVIRGCIWRNVSSVESPYLCALCIRGWESALPLLKGRQQRHRLSTNRHPFYDPHAVAAVVNTGFLGFLWRLLREKLTTRKRYWLLYIWLATLGSKCVMRRSRLDSREIQAQNPHLSVCVCPMLLAGATSTAYGDLCRRRS